MPEVHWSVEEVRRDDLRLDQLWSGKARFQTESGTSMKPCEAYVKRLLPLLGLPPGPCIP